MYQEALGATSVRLELKHSHLTNTHSSKFQRIILSNSLLYDFNNLMPCLYATGNRREKSVPTHVCLCIVQPTETVQNRQTINGSTWQSRITMRLSPLLRHRWPPTLAIRTRSIIHGQTMVRATQNEVKSSRREPFRSMYNQDTHWWSVYPENIESILSCSRENHCRLILNDDSEAIAGVN